MYDTVLLPLEGIKINGVLIPFGETRDSAVKRVSDILGEPQIMEGSVMTEKGFRPESAAYFHDSELRLDFDGDRRLEFIEFLGGVSGEMRPYIYGVSVFDAPADEIVSLLTRENNGDIDRDEGWKDTENAYGYGFKEISVGLYRESLPEDIEEMLEESPDMSPEDLEYEKARSEHWCTVGIGIKDYYR